MSETPFGEGSPSDRDARGRATSHCIVHRIEIDAPPEMVWDFIADFEGWVTWNPLYISTHGQAVAGQKLRFTVQLEGLKSRKGTAQVETVRTNELLEYKTSVLGGLLKMRRFVEVEEISPTRCAVLNREIMSGPLGGPVSRAMGDRVETALRTMNEALRSVAERKWHGRPR